MMSESPEGENSSEGWSAALVGSALLCPSICAKTSRRFQWIPSSMRAIPRLTSVGDGDNADPVVLSAGSAQLNVVCGMNGSLQSATMDRGRSRTHHPLTSSVVVDTSLGKHGIVLDLRLADGRAVAGDEDQLGCKSQG